MDEDGVFLLVREGSCAMRADGQNPGALEGSSVVAEAATGRRCFQAGC